MRTDRHKEELRELGYNVYAFGQHINAVEVEDERDYLRSLQWSSRKTSTAIQSVAIGAMPKLTAFPFL